MIAVGPSNEACRACTTRECCFDRDAPLTGDDVARIATTLAVDPSTFARGTSVGGPDPLVLARRTEPDGRSACVFLLGLGSGRRLCGLGDLAPLACRLHPSTDAGPGACWRTFTPDEVAPARAALADQQAREAARWQQQLDEWQALMATRSVPLPFEVFLDYVLAKAAEP